MAKRDAPTGRITPRHYYEAAWHRAEEAAAFLDEGRWGLALTQAGVAAECMLRASVPPHTPFTPRHDLVELAKRSTIGATVGGRGNGRLAAAVGRLRRVWRNNYRYMTEERQQQLVKRLGEYRRMRGTRGPLKAASKDAVQHAFEVLRVGATAWHREEP